MDTTIDAPLQWVESITMLRLPEQADQRLQDLMDRNNEGQLSEQERADLAALAELTDDWSDHFEWEEYTIVGKTPLGRATIEGLHLYDQRRQKIRQAEQLFGLFAPED